MFDRVLLPVDLTEKNEAAIAVASQLLTGSHGSVILLHVIETISDAPFEDLQYFYQRLEKKARAGMNTLAEKIVSGDIDVERQVVYGKRTHEIDALAQELGVDLVILTTHPWILRVHKRYGTPSATRWQSWPVPRTADQVIRWCPCQGDYWVCRR